MVQDNWSEVLLIIQKPVVNSFVRSFILNQSDKHNNSVDKTNIYHSAEEHNRYGACDHNRIFMYICVTRSGKLQQQHDCFQLHIKILGKMFDHVL